MVAAFPALVLLPGNAAFPIMNFVQPSDPLQVSWVSVHRSESLCVGPSKGCVGFQSPVSPRRPEYPLVFIVRVFGISSSWPGTLGWGAPEWDQDPPLLQRSLCSLDLPLGVPPPPVGAGLAQFRILPLLLAFMCLLYIIKFKFSNQLDFRWFSMLIIF